MLFERADDPRGALRWNLAEMRRAFSGLVSVSGDPVNLHLEAEVSVDVTDLGRARAFGAAAVPDGELLEGLSFDDSPTFDTWISAERARLASDCRALTYRLAVESLASGDPAGASRIASQAVQLDPLNADAHAVLVAGLSRSGDVAAAREQVARCADLFQRELGVDPPALVAAATVTADRGPRASAAAVRSLLSAAEASLSAGAVDKEIGQLRRAVAGVPTSDAALASQTRLSLASALIHGRGGCDADVVTLLHEARVAAVRSDHAHVGAVACRELAYLAVQRGNRAEAGNWLREAEDWQPDRLERASILGVRGMSLSDAGSYDEALAVLDESVDAVLSSGRRRRASWPLTAAGRVHVLRGEPARAVLLLDRVLADVRESRWTAFAPFPLSLRAESAI